MIIRAARATEIPRLRDIDWDAGQIFRDIGMPEAAEFEPRTLDELAESQRAGGLWVAVEEDDAPASFLMTVPVDGCLHVEQLSTAPAAARRGLGRALLDHAAGLAKADGVPALTLTTFADVPWNGPYYATRGFREVPRPTPGLLARRDREREVGLDWLGRRIVMRREV